MKDRLPCGMSHLLRYKETILIDGVPAAEKSVFGNHASTIVPCLFVVFQDVVYDAGTVADVVVSCGDDLPGVIIAMKRLKVVGELTGN